MSSEEDRVLEKLEREIGGEVGRALVGMPPLPGAEVPAPVSQETRCVCIGCGDSDKGHVYSEHAAYFPACGSVGWCRVCLKRIAACFWAQHERNLAAPADLILPEHLVQDLHKPNWFWPAVINVLNARREVRRQVGPP